MSRHYKKQYNYSQTSHTERCFAHLKFSDFIFSKKSVDFEKMRTHCTGENEVACCQTETILEPSRIQHFLEIWAWVLIQHHKRSQKGAASLKFDYRRMKYGGYLVITTTYREAQSFNFVFCKMTLLKTLFNNSSSLRKIKCVGVNFLSAIYVFF